MHAISVLRRFVPCLLSVNDANDQVKQEED